jgi:hypothetical protein
VVEAAAAPAQAPKLRPVWAARVAPTTTPVRAGAVPVPKKKSPVAFDLELALNEDMHNAKAG